MESIKQAQLPTQEELQMIRDAVLLPVLLTLLPVLLTLVERNATEISLSTYTLKKLFMGVTEALMTRIHSDLAKVNKELRARQIKVFEDTGVAADLRYRYICRGYQDKFAIIREVAKANISVKLGEYVQKVIADMKPSG